MTNGMDLQRDPYGLAKLRRAFDDSQNRTGMVVGLPKVTIDSSHVHGVLVYVDALRAALTASEKDAARWQYARQFLAIEDIERWSTDDFWRGHVPGQEESLRADAAIDAAMEKANG